MWLHFLWIFQDTVRGKNEHKMHITSNGPNTWRLHVFSKRSKLAVSNNSKFKECKKWFSLIVALQGCAERILNPFHF